MPRKHYTCKRSKAARASKAAWKRRNQEKPQDVTNTSSQLESSEDVFNRLMEESTPLGRLELNEKDDQDYTVNFSSESESDAESESKAEDCNLLPLVIEHTTEDQHITPKGRRIVDIGHVMKQLESIGKHSKYCTMGKCKYQRESLNGLFATWFFYCDNCEKEFSVTSEPVDRKKEVNDALVWGAMSVGIGYSQVEEMFSLLDVPIMNHNKYTNHEIRVGNTWEETLINKMNQNAEEEKRVAVEKNNYLNGKPFITVIGDGGWAKRSYGHGMNSLSGVGAIIGAHTQKLLFLGVRNKFCFACSNPKKKATNHLCFKNYNGPSTGMESDVILEGFRSSEESYGLVYKNYIGDGDSNVLAKIQEGCTYGRYIKKIECANHATRCLNDHLHKLAENTKFPLESRQLLIKPAPGESIGRLERLVKGVRTAMKEAGVSRSSTDLANLRHDLKNAPDHVFGNHDNCRDFCLRKNKGEENILHKLDKEFLCKIRTHIGNLESKANSLVFNETTNVAERYMGIVAKFTGGKRVNYTSGGSFKRRCIGAGLSHTVGPSWHLSPWRRLHRSPGEVFKRKILAREHRRTRRKLLFSNKTPALRHQRKKRQGKTDKNYGPDAQLPDIDMEKLKSKSEQFLMKMAEDVAMNSPLEVKTIGQHTNQMWHDQRVNRLTASKFGAVVKRLPHTSCHNMVKSILYPKNLNSEAVSFGRDNEDKVIRMYEERTANKVNKCGLFVDTDHPFLGASPDGLVSFDGLVEVKCLASVKEKSFKEEIENKKKDFCLQINECGELQLKRNHNYYYQVQGQLNITKRLWCDFVVYSKKGELFVERITKDEVFWQTIMLPKLTQFYIECILPEIVDSRVVRGMKIREPKYILDAQEKVARQKEEKSDATNFKRKTQGGAKHKKVKTYIVL